MNEERTPEPDDTLSERPNDSRLRVVTAREGGNGGIGFDDRGHARWQWKTETANAGDATGTFNELKALENPALMLEGEEPKHPRPSATTGYDPYATGAFLKPGFAKRKVRR